jgi:hypothetical protein
MHAIYLAEVTWSGGMVLLLLHAACLMCFMSHRASMASAAAKLSMLGLLSEAACQQHGCKKHTLVNLDVRLPSPALKYCIP